MQAALKKKTPFDDILDRPLSDEELARQMKLVESAQKIFAKLQGLKPPGWEKPETWGFLN